MRKRIVALVVGVGLASALGLAGCARVKPYERENHAKRTMKDRDPVEQKLENHVHEYREGAVGGGGVGGGGCGCN
jgi:hypothetical protein